MKGRKRYIILSTLLLLLLWTGCENYPTSPNANGQDIEIVTVLTEGDALLQCGPLYVEEVIQSSSGGVLELNYVQGNKLIHHTVTIPPGALPDDTLVSMYLPHPGFVIVEFEPSGVNFSVPVHVELNYVGFNFASYVGSDLHMYRWNETSSTWEQIESNVVVGQNELKVTFDLEHFSRYALGRPD